MRRLAYALVGLAAGFVLALPVARACGDKFLVGGQPLRYSELGERLTASILLFAHEGTPSAGFLGDPEVDYTLQMEGHVSRVATTFEELDRLLASEKFDILMADVADVEEVRSSLAVAKQNATVLPVVHNPSKEQMASLKKQYASILQAPARERKFLALIDNTMAARQSS